MPPPAFTEPAVRDPKKLRRTAWILVAVMIVGGFLILRAYESMAGKQAVSDQPARFHRIQKERDLRMVRQDGRTVDLFELRGKVWVVQVISLAHPETAALGHSVMKQLAADYQDRDDFTLVTLIVDPPPADQLTAALSEIAGREGMELPKWWVGSNEAPTLHKFIKSELKADDFPHQKDGRWIFDTSLVLIDREGNLRRAVVPQQRGGPPFVATFDFDQAALWDADDILTGTGRGNVEELGVLLRKTIDTVLAAPPES